MKQLLYSVILAAFFAPTHSLAFEITTIKKNNQVKKAEQNRNRHKHLIAYQDSVSSSIAASLMGKKSGVTNQNDPHGMQVKLMKR